MKKTRFTAVLLAAVLALTGLCGCGQKKQASSKDGAVTLKYVLPGPGRQKDSDKVWTEFNNKLHEKLPDVNVEFEVIPMADYKQQFLLMRTSKEQIDIANAYGLEFVSEVENGTFADMNDLLDEYGQSVKRALPDWLWKYMEIDGKQYGIPSYQMMSNGRGLFTQKAYADQWLDQEALKAELYANEYCTEKSIKIIESYLEKLADNGKIYLGAFHYNELPLKGYEDIANNFLVNLDGKVSYKFQLEEMKQQYARHAEWYKKGWMRKDSLSSNDEATTKGTIDGYTLWDNGVNPWTAETMEKSKGIPFTIIPFSDKYFIPQNNAAAGTCIMETSEYKKEAMQVLNLLQTDTELYNLLVYGIEGTHYTKIGEDRVETPYGGNPTANDEYGLYKWIIGNTEIAYSSQDEPEGYKKWAFEEVNKSEYRSKLIGFVPNTTQISDKIEQLLAIKDEYMRPLASGSLGDGWEESYNEWMEKIKIAGVEEVTAELQKQVDAFLQK